MAAQAIPSTSLSLAADADHSSSTTYSANTARSTTTSASDGTVELPPTFDRRATNRTQPYRFLDPPAPMKKLFSYFPLRVEPAESRPASALPFPATYAPPSSSSSTEDGSSIKLSLWMLRTGHSSIGEEQPDGSHIPSSDLESLIWQTYLLGRNINFNVRYTSQEAAPKDSGLPFVLATTREEQGRKSGAGSSRKKTTRTSLISRSEIHQFVALRERRRREKGGTGENVKEQDDLSEIRRSEQIGLSLIDQALRPAWLWAAYGTDQDSTGAVATGQIAPSLGYEIDIGGIAQAVLSWEAKAAALHELSRWVTASEFAAAAKSRSARDRLGDELNRRASDAMDQLTRLLGEKTYFSGEERPGLLDAKVFAYTWLWSRHDFGEGKGWLDRRLGDLVKSKEDLVSHCENVRRASFEAR